jgi:hypothetical protein
MQSLSGTTFYMLSNSSQVRSPPAGHGWCSCACTRPLKRLFTAHAHLRNQLGLISNKVNCILDPTTKVEQGMLNLQSSKKNEMAKVFYLPILKKHNALLEGLLKAEYYEVESVERIIKDVEDQDKRQYEEALQQVKLEHEKQNSPTLTRQKSFAGTQLPSPRTLRKGGSSLCFSPR